MVDFDSRNDPRIIRRIDCGTLAVSSDAVSSVADAEIQAALDRHMNLDFGDKTADEELYNLLAIRFGMGIVRSCYPIGDDRVLHIHTDLELGATKVFLG